MSRFLNNSQFINTGSLKLKGLHDVSNCVCGMILKFYYQLILFTFLSNLYMLKGCLSELVAIFLSKAFNMRLKMIGCKNITEYLFI